MYLELTVGGGCRHSIGMIVETVCHALKVKTLPNIVNLVPDLDAIRISSNRITVGNEIALPVYTFKA